MVRRILVSPYLTVPKESSRSNHDIHTPNEYTEGGTNIYDAFSNVIPFAFPHTWFLY